MTENNYVGFYRRLPLGCWRAVCQVATEPEAWAALLALPNRRDCELCVLPQGRHPGDLDAKKPAKQELPPASRHRTRRT